MQSFSSRRLFACALTGLLSHALLPAASSVPSGGNFVAGSGSILASANALTINQSSTRGVINWNNFSIGANGIVNFNNGSGATLNRVTGGNMTTILGQLLSTGSVYILNPHGVLIGPGGTIKTTGDFVATPLQISNATFMKGGALLFQGSSKALVKNLGAISSTGGSVFLIANAVDNEGSVAAANGTVGLGTGHTVLLKDSTSDQRVFVESTGGDITNSGLLTAAEVEVRASGGNIYALAGNNGGVIRATGTATKNGQVWLVADGGALNLSGTVFAENSDGTGGAVETSGHSVSMVGAKVNTGTRGSWLVDPVDLNIDASAAVSIQNALNGTTDVTEQTTATGTSGFGTTSGTNGDINVNSPISWSTGASLTLSAYDNINVNSAITNSGAGNIILRADNAATGTGTVTLGAATATTSGAVSIYYNPPAGGASKYDNAQTFTNATAGGGVTRYMLVNNVADLQAINTDTTTLAGTYAMGANIDASSVSNFVPIGTSANTFLGLFDGNAQVISNLTIDSTLGLVGLFGATGSGSIVRNVGLMNANVHGISSATGMLVGQSEGTVSSSFANGFLNASSVFAGGLVGVIGPDAVVTNSYSQGVINGGSIFEAGLVGGDDLGAISNSYSTAIAGNGLVGTRTGGSVTNSYWDMTNSGTAISNGGGTGLTRTQLQNTAQAGFSPTVWGYAISGYPYLLWQYPVTAPIAFAGFAYLDQSHSAAGIFNGTAVKGILNGTSLGQIGYTGADGYYSFEVNSSQVTNGGSMVTYLANGYGLSFWDNLNSEQYYTMPITSGYKTVRSGAPSLTTALADLTTALNGATPMTATLQGYDFVGHDTAMNIDTSTNFSGLNLVFENFSNLTQSVGISPTDLSLLANDNVVLTNAANSIGTLAAGPLRKVEVAPSIENGPHSNELVPHGPVPFTGTIQIFNSTNLHLGTTDAAQNIRLADATIQSAAGLTIDSDNVVSVSGQGIPLVLAAGTTFTNNSSSTALAAPNGNWEVWSQNPANDNRDGEAYNFKQYNATYGVTTPAQSTGNGFFYTLAPGITANLNPITKQYDGTTNVINPGSATYSGFYGAVDGDTIVGAAAAAGSYGSKNVGSEIPVNLSGLTVTASNGAANVYGYQGIINGTGSITAAPLTAVTAASNKVYNGNTTATGSATLTGLFGSDNVTVSGGTYSFSDKNVGTGKTVTASGLTLGGTDSGNYVVTSIDPTTANITPATLTLPFTPANKVYDSTVSATATSLGSLTGIIGEDQVTLSGTGTFFFSDKNVGTGKTVTGSGFSLTGTDAGNYTVVATGTGSITPAPLALTFTANNKVYNGTTTATGSVGSLTGVLTGDSVSALSATLNFSNPNAGVGKSVTGSGAQLTGTDAGNYVVTTFTQSGTASITPATLTLLFTPSNKVYDATTAATATLGSLTGIIGNDQVSVSGTGQFAFANKNVGTGKTVTGTGFNLTGSAAGNYTVVGQETQTASITPATLAAIFTAGNKVYDGTTSATGTVTGLTGILGHDSVSLGGTPTFIYANANAGSGKTASGTGGQLTGADAGNYILVYSQTGTATITPATLYYTAQSASRASGLPNPTLTGTITGFVGSDTLASATTGTAVFTTTATTASPVGTYPIVGSGVTVPSGNYVLAQAPGNLFAFAVVAANAPLLTIPSFSNAPMVAPQPLPLPAIAPLVGPNTSGFFQIGYSAAFDWNGFLNSNGLSHTNALASASSFLATQTSETPASDYAAGVHP